MSAELLLCPRLPFGLNPVNRWVRAPRPERGRAAKQAAPRLQRREIRWLERWRAGPHPLGRVGWVGQPRRGDAELSLTLCPSPSLVFAGLGIKPRQLHTLGDFCACSHPPSLALGGAGVEMVPGRRKGFTVTALAAPSGSPSPKLTTHVWLESDTFLLAPVGTHTFVWNLHRLTHTHTHSLGAGEMAQCVRDAW